jgi:hypothetical protein
LGSAFPRDGSIVSFSSNHSPQPSERRGAESEERIDVDQAKSSHDSFDMRQHFQIVNDSWLLVFPALSRTGGALRTKKGLIGRNLLDPSVGSKETLKLFLPKSSSLISTFKLRKCKPLLHAERKKKQI